MGLTITEKILSKASGKEVRPNDIVNVNVDKLMTMDFFTPIVFRLYEQLEAKKIWDKSRFVVVQDHFGLGHNIKDAEQLKLSREYARKYEIENFYDIGRNGIGHQIMVENGHALPGTVTVATDSHTTTYGALGAFACGVSTTEAAVILATGQIWFRVPTAIRINLEGTIPTGVSGKDIALKMVELLHCDGEALYKTVEIGGGAVKDLPMADRFTICNMVAEMGAKNGIFEPDDETVEYLKTRTDQSYEFFRSDPDASYEQIYTIDVSKLAPQVSCPHSMDNNQDADKIAGVRLDQVFLGSCTNGRLEDLKIAARILKGRKIASHVRMIVVPASQHIYLEALRLGYIETLTEAGAVVESASCASCFGLHTGVLAAGEVALSTTNRNFKGRMGSPQSLVYLSSPATAAASALEGVITDPRKYLA